MQKERQREWRIPCWGYGGKGQGSIAHCHSSVNEEAWVFCTAHCASQCGNPVAHCPLHPQHCCWSLGQPCPPSPPGHCRVTEQTCRQAWGIVGRRNDTKPLTTGEWHPQAQRCQTNTGRDRQRERESVCVCVEEEPGIQQGCGVFWAQSNLQDSRDSHPEELVLQIVEGHGVINDPAVLVAGTSVQSHVLGLFCQQFLLQE